MQVGMEVEGVAEAVVVAGMVAVVVEGTTGMDMAATIAMAAGAAIAGNSVCELCVC
jgi:hypothetical protein